MSGERPEDAVCKNCVHFAYGPKEDDAYGWCRRDPPQDSDETEGGFWPVVTFGQWCGEFCNDWEKRRANR